MKVFAHKARPEPAPRRGSGFYDLFGGGKEKKSFFGEISGGGGAGDADVRPPSRLEGAISPGLG